MSDIIFGASGGQVQRVILPDIAQEASIRIHDFDPVDRYAAITRIAGKLPLAYQVTRTLGDDIHLLFFGEETESLAIQGFVFETNCVDGTGNHSAGIMGLRDWWKKRHLGNENTRISIQLGLSTAAPLEFYLADLDYGLEESMPFAWNFTMTLLRFESFVARRQFADSPAPPRQANERPSFSRGMA